MDHRRQIAILRGYLPLLIASALVAGGVAFLVSSALGKVYEAKATLIVGQSLSATNPDYTQLLVSQRLSATYVEVAVSRPILTRVISALGLNESVNDLVKQVVAFAAPDSTIITITVQDSVASRAASIANAVSKELVDATPSIQDSGTAVQESIKADLTATQTAISSAQAEVARLTALTTPTAADLARIDVLQARLISLRSLYASLVTLSSGSAANLVSVVEPAVAPTNPVSPRPALNALVAALLTLVLVFGVMYGREYFKDSVQDPNAVDEVTGMSTLGSIPSLATLRGRSEIYHLVALLYPRSAGAEAYRALRTNMEFAALDNPIRTLLITSANPGEGKTVTASNLAIVFAQTGRRVLLVDADLRKPGIHAIFNLKNEEGLTTLLRRDDLTLASVARESEVPGLRILTTGSVPAYPAELLGSRRMQTVLERMIAETDLVVLDGPPLLAVTDSVIMSSYASATLLVIDADRSRRRAVSRASEALTRSGARILGAVINRVPAHLQSELGSYHDYYDETETPAVDQNPATRRVSTQ